MARKNTFGPLLFHELDRRRADAAYRNANRLTLRSLFYRIEHRNKGRRISAQGFSHDLQNYMERHNIEDYEELGLMAAERGHIFLEGEALPLTKKNIARVGNRYAALLLVEKEGVARDLAPEMDRRGVVVVDLGGSGTRLHRKLVRSAVAEKKPVLILSDYDVGGASIRASWEREGAAGITLKELFPEGVPKQLIQSDFKHHRLPEKSLRPDDMAELVALAKRRPGSPYAKVELDVIEERFGTSELVRRVVAAMDKRVEPGKPLASLPRVVLPPDVRSLLQRFTAAVERSYEEPTKRAIEQFGPVSLAKFDRDLYLERLAVAVSKAHTIPTDWWRRFEGLLAELEKP